MNDEVLPDERTARFIKSSNHIRSKEPFVKWQVFKPEFFKSQWELSIFRTDGIDNPAIKTLAINAVAGGHQDIIKGWATLSVGQYSEKGLRTISDKSTHERHGLVLGWSGDDADHMALAQSLSAIAKLDVA
jgi:hypothetical protein